MAGLISVIYFLVGCCLGGATSGFALAVALGLLSWIPAPMMQMAGIALATVAFAVHLFRGADRLPQRRAQIPESVFGQSLNYDSALFGFQYGTGCRTYITSSTPFIAVGLLVFARSDWRWLVVAGLAFGLSRALPVLSRFLVAMQGWSDLVDRQAKLLTRSPAVAAMAVFGAVAL